MNLRNPKMVKVDALGGTLIDLRRRRVGLSNADRLLRSMQCLEARLSSPLAPFNSVADADMARWCERDNARRLWRKRLQRITIAYRRGRTDYLIRD